MSKATDIKIVERDEVLAVLRESRDYIRQHFRAEIDGIFGSFARGDERSDSDIDVLITPSDEMSMFDFVALGDYLESPLGRRVDLLSKRVLNGEHAPKILRELARV